MSTQAHGTYVPTWTLGDKLRRIRRDAGKTQEQFALLLNVHAKKYAAWESDANGVPSAELLDVARRIALLYGRDASLWLLGMDDQAPPPEPPAGRPETVGALEELTRTKAARAARHSGPATRGYLVAA